MITFILLWLLVYVVIGLVIYIKCGSKYQPIIWWWFPMALLSLFLKLKIIPFGCEFEKEFQTI